MKEPKDSLQPETIDQVIEGSEPTQPDRQTAHLIQQLQTGSQKYMQENERSLDRIWHRLAQSQEHPVSLPPQWKRAEETQIPIIKEGNVMQNNNHNAWGMNAPTYIPQPQKRHTSLRIIGISLIAAVAIITIVSFTLFSNLLRPVAPTASKGALNITSVSQQLTESSNAKLVCSFGGNNHTPHAIWNPVLSWSSQGQIVVADNVQLQAFSAQNCNTTFTHIPQPILASWSPNGKMLMLTNPISINILDSHGNSIANYPLKQLGITFAALVTWSSDNTKLIFLSDALADGTKNIKSIDIRNGNVKTLLTPSLESGISFLSPDGKLFIEELVDKTEGNLAIWHVDSGKKQIFTIPFFKAAFAQELSPDGSMLAIGGAQQIQIYSTANGKLLNTLEDHDAASKLGVIALAWSSDSKYLAEGSTAIHIYDIGAQKMLTTFGKVGNQDYIHRLAWAPNNHGLVSINADIQAQNPIRVWTFE